MRIGIAGVTGRMGLLLVDEVRRAGQELAGGTSRSGGGMAALAARSDVVIDFTHASTVVAHAAALGEAGTAWVLGTSGLTEADERAVSEVARRIVVVHASNFAPGANLVLALAKRMAAALPAEEYDAEIVEMHHRQKVDAPSGTAIGLGRAVAAGRGIDLESVRESGRDGHVGPRKPGAIGFASLRGGQVIGEHTLLFAAADEQISLTHRAFDRRAFAAGAVRAARWAMGRPAGLYDMMDVVGMRTPTP